MHCERLVTARDKRLARPLAILSLAKFDNPGGREEAATGRAKPDKATVRRYGLTWITLVHLAIALGHYEVAKCGKELVRPFGHTVPFL